MVERDEGPRYLCWTKRALIREVLQRPMEVVEIRLRLEVEFMEEIHKGEREGSARSRVCCWIPPHTKELRPMQQVAFFVIIATTKGRVDDVDAREIEDYEVFHSLIRVRARPAVMSEVYAKACFAEAGLRIELTIPYLLNN